MSKQMEVHKYLIYNDGDEYRDASLGFAKGRAHGLSGSIPKDAYNIQARITAPGDRLESLHTTEFTGYELARVEDDGNGITFDFDEGHIRFRLQYTHLARLRDLITLIDKVAPTEVHSPNLVRIQDPQLSEVAEAILTSDVQKRS